MAADLPLRILVTGAGGFVGQALVRALVADHQVIATDRDGLAFGDLRNVHAMAGDLGDPALLMGVTQHPVDALIHLATVPGGAAEAQRMQGSHINVTVAVALIDAVAAHGNRPRVLFASSIAVFGDPLPPRVDDDTPASPMLRYGAHKAMVEEWIATMTRRGEIDGLSLRLPGIIARPKGPSGMKSAFMSDVFHALKAGAPVTLPVSADATCWLLSRSTLVANIIAALGLPQDPADTRLNLPALRVAMGDLVAEIARQTGADPALAHYAPDAAIEAAFGAQPPLTTARADALGLRHDGDIAALVAHAVAEL
jgi:nucleoside-diphosphate-sugar epimerase